MADISWPAQGAVTRKTTTTKLPAWSSLPSHVSLLTHSLARTGPGCQDQAEQEQHLQEQAESPGRKSISGDSSLAADRDRR